MVPKNNKKHSIAVVGSGVAGLAAAYFLSDRYQITMFESDSRLGGHSNTVSVPTVDKEIPVDTGFIVCNTQNYPIFCKFLNELNVSLSNSDMSFSYYKKEKTTGKYFYYSSDIPFGLFSQYSNVMSPQFWRFLSEIKRFNRVAIRDHQNNQTQNSSLGEYLQERGFSRFLIENYVIPMGAAIWSAPQTVLEQFPARSFIQFWVNHGLLSVTGRPQWKTVTNGSRSYVNQVAKIVQDRGGQIRLSSPVSQISRQNGAIHVQIENGDYFEFDKIVIATHADQALRLLTDPSGEETALLGAWNYSHNPTFLHTDARLMPKHRRSWASWNYIVDPTNDRSVLPAVSYYMNRLQNLSTQKDYFVTLNPPKGLLPKPESIVAKFQYTHPIFDSKSMATQHLLSQLNGVNDTYFCGSYFGFGFHEDAIRSSLAVANQLGIQW